MIQELKKTVTIFLVLALSFLPALAIPAHAQWVDVAQAAKEYGLDALAWQLGQMTISRVVGSTVNWINNGFNGSPAYITNPQAYFTNIGDQVAGQYIFNNPDLNMLCGPINARIRLALARSYMYEPSFQCTLTQVGRNFDNFMDDFGNGGWDNFFQVSQMTQNNPMGAYMQAENQMNSQIAEQINQINNELNRGNGFLTYKKCKAGAAMICMNVDPTTGECLKEDCAEADKETYTPGSVIKSQLDKSLGSGVDRLVSADEINEIVGALFGQLLNKAIGGLRDLSPGSESGSSGPSITDQLLNSTTSVGYFGETQDTSILDVPMPTTTPGIDTPVKVELETPTP